MPNEDKDVQFKLGELSGRMASAEQKVTSLETTINNIDSKIDDIRDNMNKGMGIWKTLAVTGSILMALAATFGGFIVEIFKR